MPTTPNYNWIIPTVTGDLNLWGSILNTVFNSQDSIVRAIENCNRGSSQPSTLQQGTLWVDTSLTDPEVLKIYINGQWVIIGNISVANHTFTSVNTTGFNIGDYKISMQTSNHGSWLLCNGAAISRTTYAGLYNVLGLGTTDWPFGQGDGTTTFNLPDLRGLVAAAEGLNTNAAFSPPLSTRTMGEYLGEETHLLVSTELPNPLTSLAGTANFTITSGVDGIQSTSGGGLGGQDGVISNLGGGQRHNTMQPTLIAGNYFIYSGV